MQIENLDILNNRYIEPCDFVNSSVDREVEEEIKLIKKNKF